MNPVERGRDLFEQALRQADGDTDYRVEIFRRLEAEMDALPEDAITDPTSDARQVYEAIVAAETALLPSAWRRTVLIISDLLDRDGDLRPDALPHLPAILRAEGRDDDAEYLEAVCRALDRTQG